MLYCEKCERLTKQMNPICPHCKEALHEPKDNDSVLLIELDFIHAELIASLLNDQGILFLKAGKRGAAFTLRGGTLLEEYRFLVPYDVYDKARNLVTEVFGEDEDIMKALGAASLEKG